MSLDCVESEQYIYELEQQRDDLLEAAKVALIVFTSMMEDPNFKPEATRDQIQEAIDKAEGGL